MQANPGNGFSGLAARGFVDSGSVMQLFDGTQMLVGASTVTFPFDPWMVERIEYLAGPASVLYGNGAIGGVVNVVPRRPDPSLHETEFKIGAGSFNTWRGAFDTAGAIGSQTSYRIDFSANRSSGWMKNTPSDTTAVSASLLHRFRQDLSVTLSYDFGYQRPTEYFGSPTINGVVDPAYRDVNYNVADSNIWFRDNWLMSKIEWQPSQNVRVTNRPRALAAGRHFRDVEEYVFDPATNQIDRDSYFEAYHRQRQYGDQTDVTVSSRVLGAANTFTGGVDYNFVSFQHTNNSPFDGTSVTDLNNSTQGQFINVAGTIPKYRTNTNQFSPYAEDRLAVASNVSLVGGLRLDRYGVERTNLVDGTTADRTYTPVSWRGGVVYSVKPTLSVYGQVAQASDTIRNIISSNPGQLLFDPTVGRQVEGGVKQSLPNHRVEWTLAGYYIRKTKLLAPVPGHPDEQQQIGAQSSSGVEATAVVNLAAGLRIEGNLAVLDARFDDFSENINGVLVSRDGNTPPSVPERAANLWLTWTAPHEWQFRGGLRSVGRRYVDNANTQIVPAYTVVDAGLRKRLTAKAALDVYLYNLTDKLYGTDVYFNAYAPQWMLGVPRSAEVALTFGF
jgi:iron complex outermembrane receptor protein